MSEPDDNTCPQCGGAKVVRFEMEIVPPGTRPKVNPASTLKLCTCPLPRPVHDGVLGEEYVIRYGKVCVGMDHLTHRWTFVQGVLIDGVDDGAALTPRQALSLLAWLMQNKEKLEELAREKEDEQ